MSDDQFRRPNPGDTVQALPTSARPAGREPHPPPVVEMITREPRHDTSTSEEKPRGRTGHALIFGIVGLLVGLAVGSFFIDAPSPAPLTITLDTFPDSIRDQQRDDIEWRHANSTPVVKRLDAEFQNQLTAYRFAYGGDGAAFTYGEIYTLEIVNGRLAPQLPLVEDPEVSVETLVSLNSGNTSCVSEQEPLILVMNDEMNLPRDPDSVIIHAETAERLDIESSLQAVWTECVLVDEERNLSLRLKGQAPEGDMLTMAAQYRDVLVAHHAALTR